MKTTYRFTWEDGVIKTRRLSRSFDSLADAVKFAEGKKTVDIYKSKGRFKVEWIKETIIDDMG